MNEGPTVCGFTRSETLGTLIMQRHFIAQQERTIPSRARTIARLLTVSGTTVDVPTSGVLSSISSFMEEPSVLPQTDKSVAADIPVALQQGQQGGFLHLRCVLHMGFGQNPHIEQHATKKRKFDTGM